MKYNCQYDWELICELEIDEEKATPYIKEMVEFWYGWEAKLKLNNGNYIETWLKMLTRFIVFNKRLPGDTEGWYDIEKENYGIKLLFWTYPDLDDSNISVEVVKEIKTLNED